MLGRLDGPTSSTLRSLARFNSGGHSSETEGVDGDIMDAVIRTATASMDRRPLRDRRRPSPASSASRDSVERQKCRSSMLGAVYFNPLKPNFTICYTFRPQSSSDRRIFERRRFIGKQKQTYQGPMIGLPSYQTRGGWVPPTLRTVGAICHTGLTCRF